MRCPAAASGGAGKITSGNRSGTRYTTAFVRRCSPPDLYAASLPGSHAYVHRRAFPAARLESSRPTGPLSFADQCVALGLLSWRLSQPARLVKTGSVRSDTFVLETSDEST